MPRPQMRMSGPVLDTNDVPTLIDFYNEFLGWAIEDSGPFWGRVRSPDGEKIEIQHEEHFVAAVWPGRAGEQGMQLHLDIWVDDLDAGVAWCIECGGAEAPSQPDGRDLTRLRVMLDPAGHPFCLWN